MKKLVWIFILFCNVIFSQNKEGISIIQYSANFVKDNELDLSKMTNKKINNFETLYLSKNQKAFKKEKIKFLPTIILYNNGYELKRIESNISLELPENSFDLIYIEIEKLLKNKF